MDPFQTEALHPKRRSLDVPGEEAEADAHADPPRLRVVVLQLQDQPFLLRRAQRDVDDVGARLVESLPDTLHFLGVPLESKRRDMETGDLEHWISGQQRAGSPGRGASGPTEEKDRSSFLSRRLRQG